MIIHSLTKQLRAVFASLTDGFFFLLPVSISLNQRSEGERVVL